MRLIVELFFEIVGGLHRRSMSRRRRCRSSMIASVNSSAAAGRPKLEVSYCFQHQRGNRSCTCATADWWEMCLPSQVDGRTTSDFPQLPLS